MHKARRLFESHASEQAKSQRTLQEAEQAAAQRQQKHTEALDALQASHEKDLQELQGRADALQGQVAQLLVSKVALEEEIFSQKEHLEEVQTSLDSACKRLTTRVDQHLSTEQKLQETTSELAAARSHLQHFESTVKATVSGLRNQATEMSKKISKLANQLSIKSEELEAKGVLLGKMKSTKTKQDRLIERLSQQVEEKKNQLAELNTKRTEESRRLETQLAVVRQRAEAAEERQRKRRSTAHERTLFGSSWDRMLMRCISVWIAQLTLQLMRMGKE